MIIIVLFIIGILLFFFKKEYVPFYYITWITIMPFFVDKISPFVDVEDARSFVGIGNYYIFLMLIFILCRQRIVRYNIKIALILLALFVYIFLLSKYHNVNYLNYFEFLRRSFFSIILFFYLLYDNNISKALIRRYFFFFVIIQFVIAFSQLSIGINNYIFNIIEGSMVGIDFFNGTFFRNSGWANVMSLLGIIFAIEAYQWASRSWKKKALYFSFLFLFCAGLLYSGIRVSLLEFIFCVLLIWFWRVKNKGLYLLLSSVLLIILIGYLNSMYVRGYSTGDAATGIERQIYGVMSLATDNASKETLDESTLGLSLFLLNNYWGLAPFLGSGLLYKHNGYGALIGPEYGNVSDATLAVFLTEFGLWAFLIMCYLFYNIFYSQREIIFRKKDITVIFIFLVALTVVDGGLLDTIEMAFVYMYMYYLKQNYLEEKSNEIINSHTRL